MSALLPRRIDLFEGVQALAEVEVPKLNAPLPEYNFDTIASYLTDGFWADFGSSRHSHSATLTANGSISVDITDLNDTGKDAARWALETWTMLTGIVFTEVTTSADITFDDENAGAYAYPDFINISKDWNLSWGQGPNSYFYQTYLHEIGHSLGLGHAGDYDGDADFVTDSTLVRPHTHPSGGTNHYSNESWQTTIMSYFGPNENSLIDADWGFNTDTYLVTPMIADVLAIQDLYGNLGGRQLGDTIYGEGTNLTGTYFGDYLTAQRAFIIVDDGGMDTINFSSETANQIVSLVPETFSSVGGLVGNMIIMRDTIIENFFSGSGNDELTGNSAGNWFKGGGGTDTIWGGAGDDNLNGNGKNDIIYGQGGNDVLRGGSGADQLFGGNDNDVLRGGIGRDKLTGGAGADTFVFKDGWAVDRINDFEDDIDTIKLDSNLWGGPATVAEALTYASVQTNLGGVEYIEFVFGNGDKLKVFGVSDISLLENDISIF